MTEIIEREFIKIKFVYTDQWGQETEYSKTISTESLEVSSELQILVEEFKTFAKTATGYLDEAIENAIIFKDPDQN